MSSSLRRATGPDPAVADTVAVSFGRPRRVWRWWLLALLVLVVAAAVVIAVTRPFNTTTAPKRALDNAQPTTTATVTRQALTAQTQETGTLGYADTYSVVNEEHGTLSALPTVGQVVTQGQVLYWVDGSPVVLLYGNTPAYRTLAEGATAADVTGTDVAELNADLVALGYATHDQIPAGSDEFSWWTKGALEKLQAHLGYPGADQTGALTLGQAVFVPGPARVTTLAGSLGGPAQPGQPILTATSTHRVVTLNVDPAEQGQIKTGDAVSITLPDNGATPGVVASVGKVAVTPPPGSQSTTPTITVQITPSDPKATGSFDQAPVTVNITTATVRDALVVPVRALLALAGGGYAIEVVNADQTHHLVRVQLGLFDGAKGLVQITGSGVSAGQHVVVPST